MAALLSACTGTTEENASEADSAFKWPVGKFLYVHEHSGYYFEEWSKTDNHTYSGQGHFLTRDCIDTLFSMSMRLVHKNNNTTLFYNVKNQNDNKDVEFTLTKGENNHLFVFENPFRDFPSIMQYRLLGDTAMEITQRGFENNKERIRKYTVRKIN